MSEVSRGRSGGERGRMRSEFGNYLFHLFESIARIYYCLVLFLAKMRQFANFAKLKIVSVYSGVDTPTVRVHRKALVF